MTAKKYIVVDSNYDESFVCTGVSNTEEQIQWCLDDDSKEADISVYELGKKVGFHTQKTVVKTVVLDV